MHGSSTGASPAPAARGPGGSEDVLRKHALQKAPVIGPSVSWDGVAAGSGEGGGQKFLVFLLLMLFFCSVVFRFSRVVSASAHPQNVLWTQKEEFRRSGRTSRQRHEFWRDTARKSRQKC